MVSDNEKAKRILISHRLPGKHFENLLKNKGSFRVKVLKSGDNFKKEAVSFSPHGIISMLSDSVDETLMELLPDLEIVSNYAVGFNNIDIKAAEKKGVVVTNTPGVLTDATADIAMLLILMATRRALEADAFCRKEKFTGWSPELMLGRSLQEKTLGIIGLGRIGKAVALRAASFGMNILYNKREPLEKNEEVSLGVEYAGFDDIVKNSDIISLHLPYTENVHHLFGKTQFRKMKKTAFFINTARGRLVDEKALCDALSGNEISAAGLDVYEYEPEITEELKKSDKTVLFPHIGSATVETREKMAEMVIDDCCAVLERKKAVNIVSKA